MIEWFNKSYNTIRFGGFIIAAIIALCGLMRKANAFGGFGHPIDVKLNLHRVEEDIQKKEKEEEEKRISEYYQKEFIRQLRIEFEQDTYSNNNNDGCFGTYDPRDRGHD